MSLISAQFYHMPGRSERGCVGWHCAKVKGHTEFKIVKIQSKDLYLQFFVKTGKVIERSRDVTKVKTRKVEGAPKVPLCTKYGAIPTIIPGVMSF